MMKLVSRLLYWLFASRRRDAAPTFNSEQWAGPLEIHVVDRDRPAAYNPLLDEPELEIEDREPLIIGGWED